MAAEPQDINPPQRTSGGASARAPHACQPLHLHTTRPAKRLRAHESMPSRRSSRRCSVCAHRLDILWCMVNERGQTKDGTVGQTSALNDQAVRWSSRAAAQINAMGVCLAGRRPVPSSGAGDGNVGTARALVLGTRVFLAADATGRGAHLISLSLSLSTRDIYVVECIGPGLF